MLGTLGLTTEPGCLLCGLSGVISLAWAPVSSLLTGSRVSTLEAAGGSARLWVWRQAQCLLLGGL